MNGQSSSQPVISVLNTVDLDKSPDSHHLPAEHHHPLCVLLTLVDMLRLGLVGKRDYMGLYALRYNVVRKAG